MTVSVRQVSARALLADGNVLALSELEWNTSRFAQVARFAFRAPVDAGAMPTIVAGLAQRRRLSIEISIATAGWPAVWQDVLQGIVDQVRWDPLLGILLCEGRDLGALLIDYRVPDGYLNRTSSEIVASVASACGLQMQIAPTSRMVGQFYQIEHRRLPLLTHSGRATAWDLLTELATIEGYRLGLEGDRLVFGPGADAGLPAAAWTLTDGGWVVTQGPVIEHLDLAMLPEVAATGSVRVRSWNCRQRHVVDTAPGLSGDVYDVVRPNLTDDDASALATGLLQRAQPRAWSVQITLPGELDLAAGAIVSVSGTQTGWDGLYRLDEIERSISVSGGFRQYMTGSSVVEA